ncbi:MAG: aconitate hydratase, partial [Planctomycetota bacterium]
LPLTNVQSAFRTSLQAPLTQRGYHLDDAALTRKGTVRQGDQATEIGHGAVVIAAITSCTNTSNPSVMLAAGLLAKKAADKGLKVPPYVKTSLAPGSRVVSDYLDKAGLTPALQQLGFHIVGYGCTTCIGNSGPLPDPVAKAVVEGDLVASAVLSGNRNFEGRVNPHVKANYLASPPLVVAYALAGSTDVDLATEPLGTGSDGQPVYLREIWPTRAEIDDTIARCVQPEMFQTQYANAFTANVEWNRINVADGDLFAWDDKSTYIQEPPFLVDLTPEVAPVKPLRQARVLALLGDSVTTDHISPAGSIAKDSPAGRFLIAHGVTSADFNSYGARRGNDRVMVRGTFANIRIRNQVVAGTEGNWTRHFPDGEKMSIYDAAMKYRDESVPLVVIAGAEYGTGSSRDWAAKGTYLLGVRAVIATSYERIHRSNLVGMGVLPLEFPAGATWQSLGLTGEETIDIEGLDDALQPRSQVTVRATTPDGSVKTFNANVRIDTPVEMDYYRNGGILQTVLRKLLASA